MTGRVGRHAQWLSHVAADVDEQTRAWLTDTMSLTMKLMAHSEQFRVQRLQQGNAVVLADEVALIGLPRRMQVQQREVLLRCDEVPMIYAHTIVPLQATAADWPFFSSLGERSLGTTLFGDPRVQRGELTYARLPSAHPLVQRAARVLKQELPDVVHARRCLYRRHRGTLLVTELFLPAIRTLKPRQI